MDDEGCIASGCSVALAINLFMWAAIIIAAVKACG